MHSFPILQQPPLIGAHWRSLTNALINTYIRLLVHYSVLYTINIDILLINAKAKCCPLIIHVLSQIKLTVFKLSLCVTLIVKNCFACYCLINTLSKKCLFAKTINSNDLHYVQHITNEINNNHKLSQFIYGNFLITLNLHD